MCAITVSGQADDTLCARAHTPSVRKSVRTRKEADSLSVTTDTGVRAQARDAAFSIGHYGILGGWPAAVAARRMLMGFTDPRSCREGPTREACHEDQSLGEETQGHRPPALLRTLR